MASYAGKQAARQAGRQSAYDTHHFPQIWLLVVCLAGFGFYVAWDRDLLQLIFTLDRSYMAMLICALIVSASCHAAWHIIRYSALLDATHRLLNSQAVDETALLDDFMSDINQLSPTEGGDSDDSLIEVYADKLRGPVDLGWFLVDLAVRLGLLGTIIGFILIFTSLSRVSIDGADGLQELLVAMSGGMGTALLTTLSGLIAATFLSLQYLILGREADHLVGQLVRLRIRHHQRAAG